MEVGGAGCRWSAEAAKKQVGQSRLQVSDEQWQLQVEVGGTGGRWSAKATKKQVGQRRLQVSAVTVPGRDRKTVAKKGDDPGQMSSGICVFSSFLGWSGVVLSFLEFSLVLSGFLELSLISCSFGDPSGCLWVPSGSLCVLRNPFGSLWGPLGVPSGLLSGAVGPFGIPWGSPS